MMSKKPATSNPGGVQSVNRALDLLECVAHRQAMTLAEMAAEVALPAPTAYRLARTLVDRGYLRQLPDRSYSLGFRLVPLGSAAHRLVGIDAQQVLTDLVEDLGETANLALLVGAQAEYVAQVPANFSMRMFTEVGRRVELHATGVGKALMAQMDDAAISRVVRARGLSRYTPHTIVTETALAAELGRIREQGFALDEQEQEVGVRCVAVPLAVGAGSWMAVSVSGPVTRMTNDVVERAVPLLQTAASRLVDRMSESEPSA
ncbi:IclR family transcriptional regulator [Nocardioides endophyticus]|uniref:IclR family transcriptional regulator n=1 Tax=Nocardioides endophyticus TaxID=1353775 RepID=A0ABP8YIV1_9ACTN